MRFSHKGVGNKHIPNEQMRHSRQGGGYQKYFKQANEMFSSGGGEKRIFNERMRCSQQELGKQDFEDKCNIKKLS